MGNEQNCKSCESLKRITEKKGYGFAGYYKGFHFRSSSELSFMMNEKGTWRSGESKDFAIEYELDGKTHIYYPDFIIDDKVIECKPLYAQKGKVFASKTEAAIKWCFERGMKYVVLDCPPISRENMLKFHNEGVILLTEKTLKTITEKISIDNS
jgi:hypothetical protein